MALWGPVVAGSVEPMVFTLQIDGAAINLDDYGDITPIVTDGNGVEVAEPGAAVAVSPQTGGNVGKVTWTPHEDTFTRTGSSKHTPERFGIRFEVLDDTNVPLYFPMGSRDIIEVYPR